MQMADVKIKYEEGILYFALTGEIDHHSAAAVREKMDEAICLYRPRTAVISLAALDFMDSAGLGLILGRLRQIKSCAGELILADPTPAIQKILRLAGVEKLIEIRVGDGRMEACQHEKRKNQ